MAPAENWRKPFSQTLALTSVAGVINTGAVPGPVSTNYGLGGDPNDCVPVGEGWLYMGCVRRGGLLDRITGGSLTTNKEGASAGEIAEQYGPPSLVDDSIESALTKLSGPAQRIGLVILGIAFVVLGVYFLVKGSVEPKISQLIESVV